MKNHLSALVADVVNCSVRESLFVKAEHPFKSEAPTRVTVGIPLGQESEFYQNFTVTEYLGNPVKYGDGLPEVGELTGALSTEAESLVAAFLQGQKPEAPDNWCGTSKAVLRKLSWIA